jgi:hypothetical protein
MAIEMLALAAVAAYLLFRLDAWVTVRGRRRQALEEAAVRSAQAAYDAAVPECTFLQIPGTRPLPRAEHRRLVHFGVRPDRALELLVFAEPGAPAHWPADVRIMLRRLYDRGWVRGPGITDLLFGGAPLADGQALFFAVLDQGDERAPEALAFVDRRP